ncbi:MAG: ORF6N domain-containing protein [Acidobacteriota bacterium]
MARARNAEDALIPAEALIRTVRHQKVILDSDLARLYGVITNRLNEQVKRNLERFPEDFAFRLTKAEFEFLMSQFATSSSGHGGRRKLPLVFTEHGAIMAANVLNSARAFEMSG